MSKKVNPDDIAFGFEGPNHIARGLTKREYFAALAMQGMMSADQFCLTTNHDLSLAIELAVESADRLIEELNKEKKK